MKHKLRPKKQLRFSDVPALEERVQKEGLPSGEYLYDYKIEAMKKEFANMNEHDLLQRMKLYFRNLPISAETLKALTKRNFIKLTEVQRCSIPHALAGRDVMVASKTGSGKTLSFLVPIIENLYRKKWTSYDGVGALVLVPTRELAIQVFEVLRSLLGEFHELSFGLIAGGKSLEAEQAQITQMNILVCTPGRLLQHINDTQLFSLDNLQMLVLDEADEILSMGFQNTLTQILSNVPRGVQTMLFSATLSKNILSLSKIAMTSPEQIFLRGDKTVAAGKGKDGKKVDYETPENLSQYAMVIPHQEKIDVLFSFIKSHKFTKMIVFVSCCKQVRFIFEAFKKLRIGLPMFELQARQKQAKRMAIYFTFTESKYGVLISTNLAARGLDFPKVDWIVQMDIPEDVETYVHRIGRTARFQEKGKALVLVDPSENLFLKNLEEHNMKISTIKPNPAKQLTIQKSLQVLCSEENDLKYLAQRAVISFVKSIDHMKNKHVFNIKKINLQKLSESYGLIQTPVLEEEEEHESDDEAVESEAGEDDDQAGDKKDANGAQSLENLTRNQRKLLKFKTKLREKRGLKAEIDPASEIKNINAQLNATRETQLINRVQKIVKPDVETDDFLQLKRRVKPGDGDAQQQDEWKVSKRQMKRIKPSGIFGGRNIFEIDQDTNILTQEQVKAEQFKSNLEAAERTNIDLTQVYASKLAQNLEIDKADELERIRERRRKKKEAAKLARQEPQNNSEEHSNSE